MDATTIRFGNAGTLEHPTKLFGVMSKEPMVYCHAGKHWVAKSEKGNYQKCRSCRAKVAAIAQQRKAQREEHIRLQREQDRQREAEKLRLAAESLKLRPEVESLECKTCEEAERFCRWAWYYNDEIEGTGKYLWVSIPFGYYCEEPAEQYDWKLRLELIKMWHEQGKPSAPEEWTPKD